MNERFNELYHLYNNDIYRLALSYLLNDNDAEDVIQKTYIKLYKNTKILSLPNEDVKKWLIRISINESKDILKSPWRKVITKIKDDARSISAYDNDISEMLNNINANYRIPIYLYYYEGYNIKEIALLMKKSESAIKMRLSRGREALKKEMGKEE